MKIPDTNTISLRCQGAILGILTIAIAVVEISNNAFFLFGKIDWIFVYWILIFFLMVGLPFLLRKVIPSVADFDRQWLPSAWLHWGWFLVMLFLLVVGGIIILRLSGYRSNPDDLPWQEMVRHANSFNHGPKTIVMAAIFTIILLPIAEEIFWRAFVLEQLRKLAPSWAALLIQSFLFALTHLWLLHWGMLLLFSPFWGGLILGAWRIRFRSILPLVLAHIALNACALFPELKAQYDCASEIWSKPQLVQIDLLKKKPIKKAVPAIIEFLADKDADVRMYALTSLTVHYREDAQPYLKEALHSDNVEIVKGVLSVIDLSKLSDLKPEVRNVVWSNEDRTCQLSAVLTLGSFGDTEELQKISQKHADETIRKSAEFFLKMKMR